MKIGIIGSGIVGRVLGNAFLQEGHQVMLGTRNTLKDEVVNFLKENPAATAGSFEETAIFGDVIVLATAGNVTESAIAMAGIDNFSYKTVIDTTNPIADKPPLHGVLSFFTDLNSSLMEKIQLQIPAANVVKAFNSVGNALMYKPILKGGTPSMFICGNNLGAKHQVSEILDSFGWETEDMGAAEAARAIEPLCILWCIPGFIKNEWMHAFKLLKA